MLPKVPPNAKAFIPKKMNTNKRMRIVIKVPKVIAINAGEIPNFSSDISVFFSIK